MNQANTKKAGFTLIELSIVLVIIGLIVGGVLVGQDMIKAATIRASVGQVEKMNTAFNTFYNKYNGLPGDLPNASTFFPSVTNGNETAQGDGNRLIAGTDQANRACGTGATTVATCIAGEAALAWYMLSQANLISDPITTTNYETYTLTISDSVLPQTKMGRGARMAVMANGGLNYFIIGNFGTSALVAGTGTFTAAMSPLDAFQFDSKLDDSIPTSGTVRSIAVATALPGTNANGANPATSTDCYDSGANTYATGTVAGNNVNCTLGIQTAF